MGNIIDYIKWRGDIAMADSPFNEIDNLILSMLVYVDFEKIRSEIRCGNRMRISNGLEILLHEGYRSKCLLEITPEFLETIRKSSRFGDIYISDYRDVSDKKRNCQFAAIKYALEDGTAYLAFRGTDRTIVGWRENFMMSFQETEAQLEAAAYIQDVMGKEEIRYRVGGHSKGGNLAVYASAKCEAGLQSRILKIYDNDGPGFSQEVLDSRLFEPVRDRICRIVPEYSVIGMLFELDVPFQVVKSSAKGINQHNAFSWQAEGMKFLTCKEIDRQAQYLNTVLDAWIEKEDMEHRKIFVKQIFDAMEMSGAKEIGEVTGGLNRLEKVVFEIIYSDRKTKKVLHNLVASVAESFQKINLAGTLRKRESLPGILMMILGMLLFVLPGDGLQIVGTGLIFAVFIFTVLRINYHLREKYRYRHKKFYVSLVYLICIALLTLLAFHANALKLSINFILGIAIFSYGVIKLRKALLRRRQNRKESGSRKLTNLVWVQSVSAIAISLMVLGIAYLYIGTHLYTVGLYLILLGLTEIISKSCQ